MFGESESESPRGGSPWDCLVSELELDNLPRLVPENDEGNVEYKLQLLSPSPARFARLVTQLKWRLLEGGGQAYYELGVADCGALVGLARAELEESLETLEMMAGEIGASVIVVKEIEVPAAMAGLAASKWNGQRKRRHDDDGDEDSKPRRSKLRPEASMYATHVAIDLEIASVFKPRPMRARMEIHADSVSHNPRGTALTRRQARDRKREDKQRALNAYATPPSLSPSPSPGPVPFTLDKHTHDPTPAETSALVSGLAALHVSVDESVNDDFLTGTAEDDDVFVPPPTTPVVPQWHGSRLIVEALVVRKMSLDEAFLDFGGFMLT